MNRKWALIVAAGGSGTRYGEKNKLLEELDGIPIIRHSVAALGGHADQVVVVAPAQWEASYRAVLADLPFEITWAAGGALRTESVRNGLACVRQGIEFVAIHDAARPLIDWLLTEQLLARAEEIGAALPAHRVTDTIKRVAATGLIEATIDRGSLAAVETPQVFRLDKLRAAFAYAATREPGREFTDEGAVMEFADFPVAVVFHATPNPKITAAGDLASIQALLRETKNAGEC